MLGCTSNVLHKVTRGWKTCSEVCEGYEFFGSWARILLNAGFVIAVVEADGEGDRV